MNQTLTLKSVSVYFLHRIQIHTLGSGYLSINPLFNDIFWRVSDPSTTISIKYLLDRPSINISFIWNPDMRNMCNSISPGVYASCKTWTWCRARKGWKILPSKKHWIPIYQLWWILLHCITFHNPLHFKLFAPGSPPLFNWRIPLFYESQLTNLL